MPGLTVATPELTLDDAIRAADAADGPPGLVHDWCECSPLRSLCGLDLSDAEPADVYACGDECVVCAHMLAEPCPRCGFIGF